MKKNFLFILTLLLTAVTQGAWAQNYDKWDGVTTKMPSGYWPKNGDVYIDINSAAELAWVMQNYKYGAHIENIVSPYTHVLGNWALCMVNYRLNADVDMTAGTWIPIGTIWKEKKTGTFGIYGTVTQITFSSMNWVERFR